MNKSPLLVVLALGLAACAAAPAPIPVPAAIPPRTLIVNTAAAMLGQPYRYGGAAPGGFDCSGLVFYATGRVGLHLPRTAQEQLQAGKPIGRRELRAGDLVFMHLARKELHVGIALDSERFVHAPSTGGHVRIDSLAAPPYARGFIKARRIVDDDAAAPRP